MTLRSTAFSAVCLTLLLSLSPCHARCPIEMGGVPPILNRAEGIVAQYTTNHPHDPTPLPGDLGFTIFCPSPLGGFFGYTPSPSHLLSQLANDSADYVALLVDQVTQNAPMPQKELILLGITYFSCAKRLQELATDEKMKTLVLEAAIEQLVCSREKLTEESYTGLVGVLSAVFDLKF